MNLPDIDFSYSKVFVTGVYGTGKSTCASLIAQRTGHRLLDFDLLWDYSTLFPDTLDRTYVQQHLISLGDRFVIDAIGFNSPPAYYRDFSAFYDEHSADILIFCALCLSIPTWIARLNKKGNSLPVEHNMKQYVDFHTELLPLHAGKNVIYYDTASDRCVTPQDIQDFIQKADHEQG